MRFSGKLRKGFVLGKPITQENYKEEVVTALEDAGQLIITRKRDGWKMFAAFDAKGVVRLYTDGMNEIDDRLVHLKKELATLRLKKALLVGEALIDTDDSDDFAKIGAIMHSGLDKALAAQKTHGLIRFMVFNIIFMDSKPVDAEYHDILEMIRELLDTKRIVHSFPVPVLPFSLAEAQSVVCKKGWEGLVLYDAKNFRISFRTDGKNPQRPKGCYKWKPIFEDDFIVRAPVMRPDSNEVKELDIFQRDPRTGKEFRCGSLGSVTREMRRRLANRKIYPLVVQAAFDARFEKTGKIRNGRFMRLRTDKRVEDCVAPRSFSAT